MAHGMGVNWITSLISLCHSAGTPEHLPVALPFLLFGVGFLGSMVHCAPMCGAFVLAQASDCMACIPAVQMRERSRLMAGALPLYHLGRITTYAALGALVGVSSGLLARQGWLTGASGVLLLAASVLLLLHGLRQWLPAAGAPHGSFLWNAVRPLARLRDRFGRWRYYVTGLVLGFLPCGMLGASLLAASALGSPLRSALAMVGFGLGTVPVLALLGIAGGRGMAARAGVAVPVMFLVSAVVLMGIGVAELGRV